MMHDHWCPFCRKWRECQDVNCTRPLVSLCSLRTLLEHAANEPDDKENKQVK